MINQSNMRVVYKHLVHLTIMDLQELSWYCVPSKATDIEGRRIIFLSQHEENLQTQNSKRLRMWELLARKMICSLYQSSYTARPT